MSGTIVLLLATVFLLAAISKLRSPADFGEVLQHLLPTALAKSMALLIPLYEMVLAAFLFSGIAGKAALITSVTVLAVFTIFLVVMLRRGVKGCGCFGEDEDVANTGGGIVRNLILIVLAALAVGNPQPILLYGPDVATFLGRMSVVVGGLCLWPCVVGLVNRREIIFNPAKA